MHHRRMMPSLFVSLTPAFSVAARFALACCCLLASASSDVAAAPVNLIIDTDMSTDCDDVGALCIALTLERLGIVEVLAVVHNTGLLEGVGAISSINHYFDRDSIPIGAYKGAFGSKLVGAYVPNLVANFSGPIHNYTQVPEAYKVYRKVLAQQPDMSVTIASIGFMTNLEALLKSPPDSFSDLSGAELLAAKVKSMVCMGGYFPTSGTKHEWNFCGGNFPVLSSPDPVSCEATNFTLAELPTSIDVVFSGFDVGNYIETGGIMTTCAPVDSPCRQAYIDRQGPGKNRQSWDPVTVLAGILGVSIADYDRTFNGRAYIDNITGLNGWTPMGRPTNASYLSLRPRANESLARQVDAILCAYPGPSAPATLVV
mmetsp:Transcript_63252/g.133451  ORF Transcript_63252/g.133451 Transcript_63252/m.133451 type:complete len:371 (-) Transcript_63252:57-1169(-)